MKKGQDHLRPTPQTFHDFIRSRRSIRRFRPDNIPKEVVDRILKTSTFAPSAHNRQPWRFVVLTTLEAKKRLANEMGADFRRDLLMDGLDPKRVEEKVRNSRNRICQAPLVVILCLTMSVMDSYPDSKRQHFEYIMAVQSVALAGGNILLSAHGEGLGAVWVCAPLFAQETVRRVIDLPNDWEAQGLLLIGYPEKVPEPRNRNPVNEIAVFM